MTLHWRGGQKRAAKDLFGRPLRVALAAWIVGRAREPFYLSEAQQAMADLGEAPSGVSKELQVFSAYGLVTTFEDGRRLYYTPVPSPYWSGLEAAARCVGLLSPDDDSDVSRRSPSRAP